MKLLCLLFAALLLSYSSFATVGPIIGDTSICVNATDTLTDTTAGGTWSSSNTAVATVGSTGIVYGVASGTAIISYTLGATVTQIITVNPTPGPIVGLNLLCPGDTITLSDVTPGGTWSSSSTAIATVGSVVAFVTGISAGMDTISYTIVNGCLAQYGITVYPLPTAIMGPGSLCVGDSTTLSDTTLGGTWSSSLPDTAGINALGLLHGLSAGTATITYTAGTGCKTTAVVTVYPIPEPIGGLIFVCAANTITLHDPTTGATWSSSDTSIAAIDSSGLVTGLSAGTVVISYGFSAGCTVQFAVTVNPALPLISGPAALCITDYATLSDSVAGGFWTSSDNLIATISAIPGVIHCVNVGFDTITYSTDLCTTKLVVTVYPAPALQFVSVIPGDTVCTGASATFIDSIANGTVISAEWYSQDTAIGSGSPFTYTPSNGDPITIQTTVISFCKSEIITLASDTIRMVVSPRPVVAVSPDPVTICLDSAKQLTASGAAGYLWQPNTGLSCDACASPFVTATGSMTYYVKCTSLGCSDSAEAHITVDSTCNLSVPVVNNTNTFTIFPNPVYNQLNIESSILPITKITITNVLGQTVYIQSANSQLLTVNVANLPSGVYFVQVNLAYRQAGDAEVRKFVKE